MQNKQIEPIASVIHGDQALARRLERAEGRSNAEFVEARAKAFPEIGGQWIEVAGALALFDGDESPCSQTFGLGLFESVTDSDLTKLEQFFQQRGSEVFHEVSPLAGVSLLGQLSDRGYRPIELTSILFRPIHPELQLALTNESIQVRKINADEHDLWAQTAAVGWADEAAGHEDFLLGLAQVNPHRMNTHCFLAEKQGEAIAAAAICLFDGVAVLAGACTVPKWRRQGAQLALLERRLRFAADNGCDMAMIGAQPGSNSQRNAERQGFRVAYTRTKWHLASNVAETNVGLD